MRRGDNPYSAADAADTPYRAKANADRRVSLDMWDFTVSAHVTETEQMNLAGYSGRFPQLAGQRGVKRIIGS